MKIIKKEKSIEHPLEEVFDIDAGTTIVEYHEVVPAVIVHMPTYDEKDDEIEGQYEEIYTIAMSQVADIGDELGRVEGKYKARIGEVTATMLNVALSAVREKAQLKMHKDKLTPMSGSGPNTANNNSNITADRNELIRLFLDQSRK